MNTGRLRLRFLAALGLGGAACAAGSDAKHEPTTEPSGERATAVVSASSAPTSTAAASSSASTVATVATVATLPSAQTSSAPNVTPFAPASVSAWAPEAAPNASLAQLPPGIGPGEQHPTCPSGRTCVHQASRTIGQPPFPRCASSLPGAGAARVSDLNVEITTLERAGANKDACCYEWTIPCPGGRPLIVEGAPRIADTTVSSGWSAPGAALVLATLEAVERSALATHFAREAAYEHASVASFARVTLSLLAAAAPTELILDTQRAALDEVRHARAMFAVASAPRTVRLGLARSTFMA
ncbi:MAG: hypothetical protein U0271_43480 [Polyangiaceae bacterium]